MACDLLLKGARVLDPAQGLDAVCDVAIERGQIAAIAERIADPASREIDLSGKILTPGWIDTRICIPAARPGAYRPMPCICPPE